MKGEISRQKKSDLFIIAQSLFIVLCAFTGRLSVKGELYALLLIPSKKKKKDIATETNFN